MEIEIPLPEFETKYRINVDPDTGKLYAQNLYPEGDAAPIFYRKTRYSFALSFEVFAYGAGEPIELIGHLPGGFPETAFNKIQNILTTRLNRDYYSRIHDMSKDNFEANNAARHKRIKEEYDALYAVVDKGLIKLHKLETELKRVESLSLPK